MTTAASFMKEVLAKFPCNTPWYFMTVNSKGGVHVHMSSRVHSNHEDWYNFNATKKMGSIEIPEGVDWKECIIKNMAITPYNENPTPIKMISREKRAIAKNSFFIEEWA